MKSRGVGCSGSNFLNAEEEKLNSTNEEKQHFTLFLLISVTMIWFPIIKNNSLPQLLPLGFNSTQPVTLRILG